MVQFFKGSQDPRERSYGMLAESLGLGLGNALNTYQANRSLESVMQDKSLENAPQSNKMAALQTALSPYGKKGQEILQQRMQIAMQEEQEKEIAKQEEEQEVLGRIVSGEKVTAKELSKLKPENQLKVQEFQQKKQFGKNVYQNLIDAGYPENTAQLWQSQVENSTIGGLSDTIKQVNELLSRSPTGKGLGQEQENTTKTKPGIELGITGSEPLDLDFPELPEPIGMKSSDIVKQNEYREKINIPIYNEAADRLDALDEEYRDIQYLQELDKHPEKLPSGVEKWNVDWETGDLRVKALATPEAQAYVKTIARMSRKAKDFYPGRVTNFDLDNFKAGFATLANSAEGRQLINQQLATANRIAYLKDETLKASMDHYGSGADPVLIRKAAQSNYRRLKKQLEGELLGLNEKAEQLKNNAEKPFTREKVNPGTPGDASIADKYLKANNLDPAEAEKQAREDGYVF